MLFSLLKAQALPWWMAVIPFLQVLFYPAGKSILANQEPVICVYNYSDDGEGSWCMKQAPG